MDSNDSSYEDLKNKISEKPNTFNYLRLAQKAEPITEFSASSDTCMLYTE